MNILRTASNIYGPFNSITTLDDRYLCDGGEYPFSVTGEATIEEYIQGDIPPPPFDRDVWKAQRAILVDAILVTIDGMVFNGDETSQDRMARAIVALNCANVPTTQWTLADNTTVDVTVAQLSQALIAAGLAQTAIWTPPQS